MNALVICGTQHKDQDHFYGKNGHPSVLGLEICALKSAGPNQWAPQSAAKEHCECVGGSCKSAVPSSQCRLLIVLS